MSPRDDGTVSIFSVTFGIQLVHDSPDSPSSSGPKMSVGGRKPVPYVSVTLSAESMIIPKMSRAETMSYPIGTLVERSLPLFHLPGETV